MMKKILLLLAFYLLASKCFAQNEFARPTMDSLKRLLSVTKDPKDSLLLLQKMVDITPIREGEVANYSDRVTALLALNKRLKLIDPAPYQLTGDGNTQWRAKQYVEALKSLQAAIELFDKQHKQILPLLMNMRILYNLIGNQEERLAYYSKKLDYYLVNGPVINTAPCYHAIGGYYLIKGANNLAINNYLKGAEVFRQYSPIYYANAISVVGITYANWGNLDKAGQYINQILPEAKRLNDQNSLSTCYYGLSLIAFFKNNFEEALKQNALDLKTQTQVSSQRTATSIALRAGIYLKMGKPDLAFPFLERVRKMADSTSLKTVNAFGNMEVDFGYYQYYKANGALDQAEKHLLKAYQIAVDSKDTPLQLKYLKELGDFYKSQKKPELSGKYFDQYFQVSEEQQKNLDPFKIAQYEIDQNDKAQRNHITQLKQEKAVQQYEIGRRNILLWGSMVVLALITALLVFIYRQLQTNKKTLISLRQTQRQLIQSEKMASLGELTAGIAHEIQNPLNFVNNFSEVNIELLEELDEELKRGEIEEALDISSNIKQNLEKIGYHGKRADGIVKGMLQHSRASSGQKEPTDVNVLADEYLRLAYHGLRAKDKSFNADLVTQFDEKLPKAPMVPQDVGRVVLNLLTNAFYAVQQKQKTAGPGYKPTLEMSTGLKDGAIEIKVKDNGLGIPENIKEKIMQPFFTTKPTGEGTGLGLSMSYDIIVKGHGGKIDVNTKEGEFTEFTITLPL